MTSEMPDSNYVLEGELITTETLPTFLRDTGERVLKSFVQGLLTFVTAGVGILAVPWGTALQSAGLLALATLLLALTTATITFPNPWIETVVRAARTFLAGILAAIPMATPDGVLTFADVDWARAASLAATLAAISVLTSVGSLPLGRTKMSPSIAV